MNSRSGRTPISRLADYIEAEQQAVTDRWLLAVRRDPDIPSSDRLTHEQLLDHLPQLCRELCEFLHRRDPGTLSGEMREDARKHGRYRWRDGYRIDELLREIEILKRILLATTLTTFGVSDAEFSGTVEITGRTLVHEFFSGVTIESVKQFMQDQQAVVQTHTAKIEEANVQLSRTNVELKSALSQRQRLTAVVAHELRNFVQALAYAFRLWERKPHDEQARSLAQAQIRDMQELLQQLLDHSTLIGSPSPLTIESFELQPLHEELMAAYTPAAGASGLRLTGSCSAALGQVAGDRLKTKQIAANLLSNAIKYTPEGEVCLSFTSHDDQRWKLQVTDTGPGIGPEAGARLFSGLGEADETLPGRGIGLGITKDLVDLLGGSISVVSREGEGTRFEILIPRQVSAGSH